MQSGESPAFLMNTLASFSGLMSKQSKKPAKSSSILFIHGNGAYVFLWNVRLSLTYIHYNTEDFTPHCHHWENIISTISVDWSSIQALICEYISIHSTCYFSVLFPTTSFPSKNTYVIHFSGFSTTYLGITIFKKHFFREYLVK